MYREPEKPAPWWLETFVITRTVFGVLFWPLAALFGVVVAIVGLVFAFEAHWGFGVMALALIAAAVGAFAWWENRRFRPPS
ncbi:MAG: hypothetical protein HYS09_02115 [Chloroflexi bacterium]|nr:hypothetical protein [Chloroflexota bacterium]